MIPYVDIIECGYGGMGDIQYCGGRNWGYRYNGGDIVRAETE